MRKLYENFHIFYFQKRIVSAETIRGNTVSKQTDSQDEDLTMNWSSSTMTTVYRFIN
jgi:hypothetical protein